jgi:hypothetical protein
VLAAYPPVGTVNFARISAALILCGHFSYFVGCAVGDTGRLFFTQRVPTLPPSVLYGALGVRAGIEVPVAGRLFLRTAVDLRAPISPSSYTAARTTVFQASGPGVGLGLGLVAEL